MSGGGKARWLLVPIMAGLAIVLGLLVYWWLGKTVSGIVVDIAGQPISGATVGDDWYSATTDQAGHFTTWVPFGTINVTAKYNNDSGSTNLTDTDNTIVGTDLITDVTSVLGEANDNGATNSLSTADIQAAQAEQQAGYHPKPTNENVLLGGYTISIPTLVTPPEMPPLVDPTSFTVNDEGMEVVPGEIILGWQVGTTAEQRDQIITQAGGAVRYDSPESFTTIVYVANQATVPTVLTTLQQSEKITGALQNYRWEPDAAPNDPDYKDKNKRWWLQRINAEPMWAITKGSRQVVVAVIDAGFQTDHPDLRGVFTGASLNYTAQALTADAKHGTHVAGIIAAQQNNNLGLTGVAPNIRILPIKINDIGRLASIYPVLTKLRNVRIATMSMGWVWSKRNAARAKIGLPPFSQAYMQQQSERLDRILRPGFMAYYEAGGVMCKSAGNDYALDAKLNGLNFPEVITVAASMPKGGLTAFSNVGAKVDIVAPGYFIWSTINGSTYNYLSGTSMATPIVAGTIAVIRSVKPNYGPLVIKMILKKSSTQPGDLANTTYAHLDAWRALLRATKLFGVTGSVDTAEYTSAQQALVSTKPSFWTGVTDVKGEFVIPFLKRQSYTLLAKKGDAKGEEDITDPPMRDDEVLQFVNIMLEGDDTNVNANENSNSNENRNTDDTDNTNTSAEGGNTNSANDGTDSTDSVDDANSGGYTTTDGIVVSAAGCAESGYNVPAAEGNCPAGFYFSRETIACEQIQCPDGVGRTYTLECKCESPHTAIYACDKPGYLVACL